MVRFVVLVVVVLGAVTTATAAGDAASVDPDTEIAKRHYALGTELYSGAKYTEAIAEFEAAQRVKPLPAFDYNIARCHDRLDHPAAAISAYERFLSSGPAPADATEVRERIRVLKARLAPAATVEPLAAASPQGGGPPESRSRPAESASKSPLRRAPLLIAGGASVAAGVILAAAALGTGLTARSSYHELLASCGVAAGQCRDGYESTRDAGRRAELAAWVLAPISVAALAVGTALLVVGKRRAVERLAFAPAVVTGGAALAVWGTW